MRHAGVVEYKSTEVKFLLSFKQHTSFLCVQVQTDVFLIKPVGPDSATSPDHQIYAAEMRRLAEMGDLEAPLLVPGVITAGHDSSSDDGRVEGSGGGGNRGEGGDLTRGGAEAEPAGSPDPSPLSFPLGTLSQADVAPDGNSMGRALGIQGLSPGPLPFPPADESPSLLLGRTFSPSSAMEDPHLLRLFRPLHPSASSSWTWLDWARFLAIKHSLDALLVCFQVPMRCVNL